MSILFKFLSFNFKFLEFDFYFLNLFKFQTYRLSYPWPLFNEKTVKGTYGAKYSRMDQVEFLADSLYKNSEVIWSAEAMKF